MKSTTRRLLADSRNEKDVENAYRSEILAHVPDAKITSPFGSDGYAEFDTVRALLEFKYDQEMKRKSDSCRALTQLVFYLKKFENAGEALPNVLFVGDKNECFVLGTGTVQKFLDMKIDWSTPPSEGNSEVTRAMVEDADIAPFVFNVDDSLDFKVVLDKIRALSVGEVRKVRATLANVGAMFAYWSNEVFNGSGLTPVEQVDVFLKCLFGNAAYLHPTKNLLVIEGREIPVKVGLYKSFFSHFEQGYKPSEIEAFYAQKDRLVEDDARRRQGAFFTPSLWVDEAHKVISDVLGPNWRDECLVWDNSCGTGNLTRDYTFKNLILTTAEKPDVEVICSQGYNPGALVAQYDFLNPGVYSPFFDEGEQKNLLPDSIVERLRTAAEEGKRLVWFMNPPYAEDGVMGAKGETRGGIASETLIARELQTLKMGRTSRQLYAQFFFQCAKMARDYGFKDYTVAVFSKPTFMSSGSYKPFRDWWYGRHEYKSGFLFQASHFADVSSRWGISFTVWNSPGKTNRSQDIAIDLKDIKGFYVVKTQRKNIYISDGREASKWADDSKEKGNQFATPKFSSGLKVQDNWTGGQIDGSLGVYCGSGNNIMKSGEGVYLLSGKPTSRGDRHFDLLPPNWSRTIALYSARKLVVGTWFNDKDEYLVPDETLPGYEQWVNDCHLYAVLHPSNNCTSMRSVSYKNKTWTIHNHFFWLTQAEALTHLDNPATPTLYRDAKNNPAKDVFGNPVESTPNPYLAHVLKTTNLSPDALLVLDLLTTLWVKSLPHREQYAQEHPELHLTSWDAGVYQLKHLWRDLFPTEWMELQAAHKKLASRLQSGVYEFRFLRK